MQDMIADLHNPLIGTKRSGKADPTLRNDMTMKEQEETIDKRTKNLCELYRVSLEPHMAVQHTDLR